MGRQAVKLALWATGPTCNIALGLDSGIGDRLAVRDAECFDNATCYCTAFKEPAKFQGTPSSPAHFQIVISTHMHNDPGNHASAILLPLTHAKRHCIKASLWIHMAGQGC